MALAILLALVLSVLWLGVFGLGAFVTWRGVRGRVVDGYPRCARCRYVITGAGVRPERCPECGGSLLGVGAVRLGMRKAHPPLIATGALIMLASLTPTGLFVNASAPTVAAAPTVATLAQARPMTVEQAARLRQLRKDRAARASRPASAPFEDGFDGPPAPDPAALSAWLETTATSAPPAAGETFGPVPTPPDHDADWMTLSLGQLVGSGASTPAFVLGRPSEPAEPSVPSAPAPPGASDTDFVAGIDFATTSLDRGDGTGTVLAAYRLVRNGFPGTPSRGFAGLAGFGDSAGSAGSGRYTGTEAWEIGPAPGGVSPFSSPYAGARLVPSLRLDHRVAPAYLGARPGLRAIGPAPGAAVPAGPQPIDIRPPRVPAGR